MCGLNQSCCEPVSNLTYLLADVNDDDDQEDDAIDGACCETSKNPGSSICCVVSMINQANAFK